MTIFTILHQQEKSLQRQTCRLFSYLEIYQLIKVHNVLYTDVKYNL